MKITLALLAPAALALLTACPCTQPADHPTTAVASVPSPELYAEYVPAGDGTFQAMTRVASLDAGRCFDLPSSATSDLNGVSLPRDASTDGAKCACHAPAFVGGAAVPGAAEGTFRVTDGQGDLTAVVPDLFTVPTVAIVDATRQPLASLAQGARVHLEFAPANTVSMIDLSLAWWPTGAGAPAFVAFLQGGTIGTDGSGYYFDVPASAPTGTGVLAVTTLASLRTSSCTSAPGNVTIACEVLSQATRRLSTSIVQ